MSPFGGGIKGGGIVFNVLQIPHPSLTVDLPETGKRQDTPASGEYKMVIIYNW